MSFSRALKRALPAPVRNTLRDLYLTTLDRVDDALRPDALRPPRRLVYTGSGDFASVGEEFLGHFRELAGLRPTDRVLDVGSGIGRMAIPLTRYLREGSYEGFDIVPEGVRWCQQHITPRFPSFRFQHADIRNSLYNPNGRYSSLEYRFPYEDGSFDFVFLTSVFTHLLPDEVEHYLDEIARVLRPGGRCLMTLFLLNDESLSLRPRANDRDFSHDFGCYRVIDPETPADAVAFDEEWIRARCAERGLPVRDPVHFGSWCGRTEHTSYQDLVVVDRQG